MIIYDCLNKTFIAYRASLKQQTFNNYNDARKFIECNYESCPICGSEEIGMGYLQTDRVCLNCSMYW